jgi:thiamine-monophosphate kinase
MNEFDFIRRVRAQAQSRPRPARLVAGIGDDGAVIDQVSGVSTVITADLLVEDIDFHREMTPPRLLGHKALAVSLSDIAAMGARPVWAFISFGLPEDVWKSTFVDQFYEGIFALADRYGVTLAGGDVSRAPDRIVIDSVVLGEVASGAAILRSGAKCGDQVYVTGALGGAAAGLKLMRLGARLTDLEAENKSESRVSECLLKRQLSPQPRVGWGIVLGEERLASAMIDLSDGLSSDLRHLCCESNAGALVQSANLPIDRQVIEVCGRRALDPLMLALHGGEDFELLFTVHPQDIARLPKLVDGSPISQIGEITDEAGSIQIAEKDRIWDLEAKGFAHFTA